MHIYRLNQNKSPLKISEKVAMGVLMDSGKILRAPIHRAHRAVSFAIAQLSCLKPLLVEYNFQQLSNSGVRTFN